MVVVAIIIMIMMLLAFKSVLLISTVLKPRILPRLMSKYPYASFFLHLRQTFLVMRPTILASKVAETWKAEFRFEQGRQNIEIIDSETLDIISK